MDLQRLKFAWARGARIEREAYFDRRQSKKTCWIPAKLDDPLAYAMLHRIHPHDAHLEYGPISSALIKQVSEEEQTPYHEMAMKWVQEYMFAFGVWPAIYADLYMFELFAAEYLADQGL